MSLSKPVRHCPSSCRGCTSLAAMGGGYFPFQPPGSPLGECYDYALAAGIIDPPSSSNADLVPAPLSLPAKSAKRSVGDPLHGPNPNPYPNFREEYLKKIEAVAATVEESYEKLLEESFLAGVDFELDSQQSKVRQALKAKAQAQAQAPPINNAARPKEPQAHDTDACSSSSFCINFDVEDSRYPLGHVYIPPIALPLPSDPLFTFTTHEERYATTFVGKYAMRMYDAYRASGVDMRAYEVRGEWEKTGAKRWVYSLGKDKDMGEVKKVLGKGKDAVMSKAREKLSTFKLLKEYDNMGMAVEMQNTDGEGESDLEEGEWNRRPFVQLNAEVMLRAIQKVVKFKFDPLDWQGPDWIGSEASIFTLKPQQQPIWLGCEMNREIPDNESDETSRTTYVRLAPPKQMDFAWYERRNDNDRLGHEWPHQVRWTMSNGTIREFSMGQVYESLTSKFSLLRKRLTHQQLITSNAETSLWILWWKMAKEMNIFEWFWDEDKRILVQGYSGHHDYERDCDWIDEQLDNWKAIMEEGLEANHKAVKSGDLTNSEVRYALIGEHLLKRWKKGPGMMVSKTPSDEKMEGSLLGPHTIDGASHINYLASRIADACKQREEIERIWTFETAPEDVHDAWRALVEHIKVLDSLKYDLEEKNRRYETGQSPIFKDKNTRRELSLWQSERRGAMRLWEKKPQEENKTQGPIFEDLGDSQNTEEAIRLMEQMCEYNNAA
ncbi:hypothetical protein NHQ30_006341 [Ciborinia camelliae]|nr:hypothetical protein NHQ30_006341 [Ciborinia camelliae]